MTSCGANVIINDHQQKESAAQLAKELQKNYCVKTFSFKADVANQKEVIRIFEFIDKSVGSIDVLVNNAGCETIEHAMDLKLDEWDLIFNVNLKGAFICSQEAGKRMIVQNKGVIINISSIHDKVPRKGLVHYCSAKAGMNMMTKCLAPELATYNTLGYMKSALSLI